MLDNLLLEVQRSLDYFEGQLRQPAGEGNFVYPGQPDGTGHSAVFCQQWFFQGAVSGLSRWLAAGQVSAVTAAELASCWPVLAGALELLQQEDPDETQS